MMNTKSRFALETLVGFVFLAVALPYKAWPQGTAQKVILTYPSRSIASLDLFIAQDKGFFREEGLDAQLVQIRGNVAIAAALTGEIHGIAGIGTVIRAIERGDAPFKVLVVDLKRPLFWLATRPESTSISALKGKTLGTTTFGGSQHVAAVRLLRKGGLDPEKDITVIVAGDAPTQLQGLVSGAIQVAALSPPTVITARDKFKMRILASAVEEFPSLQNGIAVTGKLFGERRDLVKRIVRARAKANRYFWENEKGASEVLARYLKVEPPVALESYRLARPAFTADGIPTEEEMSEYLQMEAQLLGLAKPVPASKVFDFSLQREVNQEIGIGAK